VTAITNCLPLERKLPFEPWFEFSNVGGMSQKPTAARMTAYRHEPIANKVYTSRELVIARTAVGVHGQI
jgi:hypothetical protein